MQSPSNSIIPPNTGFEEIKNPKIMISSNEIIIKQLPFYYEIFLAVFLFMGLIYMIESENRYDKTFGIIILSFFSLLFLHKVISLPRVKFDFTKKIVFRSNFNPFVNLYDKLLQHPLELEFNHINKIYYDYYESPSKRYFVLIRTEDPYNLVIATFKKEDDAKRLAQYLSHLIHQ